MIVTILNADDVPDMSGDTFDPQGVLIMPRFEDNKFNHDHPLNIVPVYFGTDCKPENLMGEAILFMDGSKVLADIKLFKDLDVPLYPSIIGKCIDREPNMPGRKGRITKFVIEKVVLTVEKNQDKRIQPLCIRRGREDGFNPDTLESVQDA